MKLRDLKENDIVKLEPTSLYLSINKVNNYELLGEYFEYDFDFDVRPYIKESIRKEVSILGRNPELCTHFYDYIDNKYSFMLNDGHSFQSLIISNGINFDEDVRYYVYKKRVD